MESSSRHQKARLTVSPSDICAAHKIRLKGKEKQTEKGMIKEEMGKGRETGGGGGGHKKKRMVEGNEAVHEDVKSYRWGKEMKRRRTVTSGQLKPT